MLWLTWHMWILLLLAFMGGVVTGWILRGKSDVVDAELPKGMIEAKPVAQPSSALNPETQSMPSAADLLNEHMAEREGERSTSVQDAQLVDVAPVVAETASSQMAQEDVVQAAPDDLTEIKGLGPKAAEKLKDLGVTRFEQIAAWSDEDVARIDEAIAGRGRIDREAWVKQAQERV